MQIPQDNPQQSRPGMISFPSDACMYLKQTCKEHNLEETQNHTQVPFPFSIERVNISNLKLLMGGKDRVVH